MRKHHGGKKKLVIRKPIKKKVKDNLKYQPKSFKKYRKYKKKRDFYTLDRSSYFGRLKKQQRLKNKRYITWFKKFVKYIPFKKAKYRKNYRRRFRYKFYYYGALKKKLKLKWVKRFVFRDILRFKQRFTFKFILAVSNKYRNRFKIKLFEKYFKALRSGKRNRLFLRLFLKNNLKNRFRKIKFRKLSKIKKKKNYKGIIIIFAQTKNNFLISCVNKDGDLIAHYNAGQLGFAGRTKVFPHTAYMCGKKMRIFLAENRIRKVSLLIKSKIRKKIKEAVRGFMHRRIRIRQVFKRIPVTHNGIRTKKQKRK